MAEIKVVSYKDERLEFFENQRRAVQKRYDRLEKTIDPDEPYLSERRELLSDCGRELSFYNDVIEMLEADVIPKSEVEKIFEELKESVASKIPVKIRPIGNDVDFTDGFRDGKTDALIEVLVLIANFKKKYTE